MKPITPCRIPLLIATVTLLAAPLAPAFGADVLVLKNGQRREGEIVGMSGTNVSMRVGPATSAIPLADVASVEAEAPEAFKKASTAMQEGSAARALVEIRPVIDKYRGLPIDWARQAFAIQGDALIALGQLDEAQKVFEAFSAAYPEGDTLASISSARLDIARKDFASAKSKIEPVTATAAGIALPSSEQSAQLGRAFLLLGQINEASGDSAAALEAYLKTVTIFYADSAAVSEAQSRADALKSQKNVIVP
jgi:tetratricopeptide (TPR) repeat protein